MRKRAIILSTAITFGFIAVVFRLVDIMLFNHEWFSAKARFQQVRKEMIPVKRGIIFDRRGRELAINLDTESIYCDPSEITSPDKVASALSERINQKPEIILAKLNTDRRFNWIERKVDIEYVQGIKDLKLKGIGFAPEVKRYYPKGSLASHVIGFVNVDNNGLEGVEQRYDRYLASRSEKAYVFRDAKGNVLSDGQGFSLSREIKGNNLVLTIDEGLQYILEKNLDAAYLHWKAASATAIMMDPYTGEILAMANRPTFDINDPSNAAPNQRRNRAITDCYEPGSTFKIIVGTAALEEGIVNPDTKFDCSAGYIEVGGKRIKDDHRHGVLSFKEVIQKSSNVGTIKIGLNLGRERLYEYIKRFGFGEKTGIDVAGEVSGWVYSPSKWSGTSIGAISIGQEVAVTPLQVLRAYAAIANGGFLVRPYVVSEVKSPEGNTVYKINPEAKRILSEKTANVFREILKTVTEEGGTALEAAVDGNQVAGKTGTAQLIDPKTKRYSREKFVSSFVGFVPADKPKIAMIIVIHEPKGQIYGGVVAAPVFRKIASESLSYLSVPRDDSGEKGLLMVSKNSADK
ncbi:MAG: penicillin-binding protein 2 [Thermodesulfovibrionales bacterium]|jgi:cell division protein FtsI (penicillin-binding protein 3)|nr:penicillin-binding protein 2 [Thermodesulfovibrionales bacterium]